MDRLLPNVVSAASPQGLENQNVLAPVWSMYYRQGYDEGYRRAVSDLVRSLIELSEQYIDQNESRPETAAEMRRVLFPFEEFLEQKIHRMSPDDEWSVEGGLGI